MFTKTKTRNICVIKIIGEVAYGNESVNSMVDFFDSDKDCDDIVLYVNSSGGSLACAQTLVAYINRWKNENKDRGIYGYIEDTALSAALYLLLSTDKVYAEKASIVGGMGALIKFDDFSELYKKIGVEINTYKSGVYKDLLNIKRPLSEVEKDLVNNIVDDLYIQFKDYFLAKRPSLKDFDSISNGKWYTGSQAKEANLIHSDSGYIALLDDIQTKYNHEAKPIVIECIETGMTVQPTGAIQTVLAKLGLNTNLMDMLSR